MLDGWIKVHRAIFDNPIVCKNTKYFAVWIYLLGNATHKEYDTYFKNTRITLKPGQLVSGRLKISEKFSISDSTVQRILKTFENEQMIEQSTCRGVGRIITINNWDLYQASEQSIEQSLNKLCTKSEQTLNIKQEY